MTEERMIAIILGYYDVTDCNKDLTNFKKQPMNYFDLDPQKRITEKKSRDIDDIRETHNRNELYYVTDEIVYAALDEARQKTADPLRVYIELAEDNLSVFITALVYRQ